MARIFICYRRQDTAGHARHLYAALSARFGVDAVFFDHELDPGADFAARGLQALACSQIVLVLIGPRWGQLLGADGRRRLEDPADLVRVEIERALERPGLEVVPVLVEQATMPLGAELPSSLAGLASRNAAALSDARWDHDLGRLMQTVERALGCRHRRRKRLVAVDGRRGRVALGGAVIALTTVVLMFAFVLSDQERAKTISATGVGAVPRGWPKTLQLGAIDLDGPVNVAGMPLQYEGIGDDRLSDAENRAEDVLGQLPPDRLAVFAFDAIGIQEDPKRTLARLNNRARMAAWFRSYLGVLRAAKRSGRTVVVRVEPHLWAHAQRSRDEPARVPAKVSGSDVRELAGDADNLVGFSSAVIRLRDQAQASNVLLMWHLNEAGVNTDFFYSGYRDISELAWRSYRFYAALDARFDLFSYTAWEDFRGRKQQKFWPGDVAQHQITYLQQFARRAARRAIVIGIPLAQPHNAGPGAGNWSRGADGLRHLRRLRNAGVVGVILLTGEDHQFVRRFAQQLRGHNALAL
jgi:TIR domain